MRHAWDGKIGGSQIAAIAGRSPFADPLDVWCRIKGLSARETTDAMLWGEFMGPSLVQMYAARERLRITHVGAREARFVHPTMPLAARPDGLIRRGKNVVAPIEAKMPLHWSLKSWGEGAEEIPAHYIMQCVVEYGCVATKYAMTGDYTIAIAGSQPKILEYRIKYSEDLFLALAEVAERFIKDYVEPNIAPPAGPSRQTSEYLKRNFPSAMRGSIENNEEFSAMRDQYKAANKAVTENERIKDSIGNRFRQALEDHDGIDGVCTYRNNKDSEYIDYKALATSMSPDVDTLKLFTKIKPGPRVLRFK